MKQITILIMLVISVFTMYAQNLDVKIFKDTCCEYRIKPKIKVEGYYVLNKLDTIYFKKYRNLLKCLDGTTILANPNNTCQTQSFGKLITASFYINYIDRDSIKHTFSGILKDGFTISGTTINYYPNGKIRRIGQIENRWNYGIWTFYYESGNVASICLFIPEVTHSITEWNYDENGVLVDYSDEREIMEELMLNMK